MNGAELSKPLSNNVSPSLEHKFNINLRLNLPGLHNDVHTSDTLKV